MEEVNTVEETQEVWTAPEVDDQIEDEEQLVITTSTVENQLFPQEVMLVLNNLAHQTALVCPELATVLAYLGVLVHKKDLESIKQMADIVTLNILFHGNVENFLNTSKCTECIEEDCPDRQ